MNKAILTICILTIAAIAAYMLYPMVRGTFASRVDDSRIQATWQGFLDEKGIEAPIQDVNLVVTKNNRMLYLLSGDQLIGHWRMALGRVPTGGKHKANDGRTPEGEYKIVSHDKQTPYHLFLAISYPGCNDADRAFAEGLITDRVHNEIYQRFTRNQLPNQDTPMGGEIGIQGGGISRDWTNGSIAVEDNVVEILWMACPNGTPVEIFENFTDWELADNMPSYE